MKIAIIGGGISGLATYLQLQKNVVKDAKLKESFSITIFEPYDLRHLGDLKPADIPSHGGGYGLAPNGMASLRRLDPDIHEQILRNGFPSAKTWMKSARGWTLGSMPFFDVTGEYPECCVMVLRETVLQALYKRVPLSNIVQQRVIEVKDGENSASIKLDNGEEHTFDLIIGADGIWSKARRALIGDSHPPEYKGLFSVSGFIPTDHFPTPPETGPAAHAQTVMTFGPNGFFAYTPYQTGDVKATNEHIRGEATLPRGKMGFWWSRSAQKDPKANPDEDELNKELIERHSSWKDPTIMRILQNSEVKIKLPTYVLPKMPTWAGQRVVLVGDAAHALPSSSGQGISQCLEDAEALSILLGHSLQATKDQPSMSKALATTFKEYMQVRKAHVEKVLDAGNRAGDTSRDMNAPTELMMYGAMWVGLKFFGAYFMKEIINYNVLDEVDKVKRHS